MEDKTELLEKRVQQLEAKQRLVVAMAEAVAWATIAGFLALFLVIVPRSGGRILPHVFNVAHVVLSAVVALVGYRLTRTVLGQLLVLPRWFPWVTGVGAVVIFGGGLEIAQRFVPGQPSWRDFAIDVMGGVAGLLLFVPPPNTTPSGRGLWFKAAGVVVAVAALAPSASAIGGILVRDQRFPELARFELARQSFVYLRGGAKLSAPTAPSEWGSLPDIVQLNLPAGGYAGVAVTPPRGDWKPYKDLLMPVFSFAPRPLTLNVRIHDFGYGGNADDRFSTEVSLTPGANELRFRVADIQQAPSGRKMALNEIGHVSFWSSQRKEPVALLLGPWRLE